MTRKLLLILATVAALVGAGVGGAAIAGAFDGDDERVLNETVGGPTPSGFAEPRLTVDDGIARDKALALARAATERVPGQALSVDGDDGDFEVEVRKADGTTSDVTLDAQAKVVSVDADTD